MNGGFSAAETPITTGMHILRYTSWAAGTSIKVDTAVTVVGPVSNSFGTWSILGPGNTDQASCSTVMGMAVLNYNMPTLYPAIDFAIRHGLAYTFGAPIPTT